VRYDIFPPVQTDDIGPDTGLSDATIEGVSVVVEEDDSDDGFEYAMPAHADNVEALGVQPDDAIAAPKKTSVSKKKNVNETDFHFAWLLVIPVVTLAMTACYCGVTRWRKRGVERVKPVEVAPVTESTVVPSTDVQWTREDVDVIVKYLYLLQARDCLRRQMEPSST